MNYGYKLSLSDILHFYIFLIYYLEYVMCNVCTCYIKSNIVIKNHVINSVQLIRMYIINLYFFSFLRI